MMEQKLFSKLKITVPPGSENRPGWTKLVESVDPHAEGYFQCFTKCFHGKSLESGVQRLPVGSVIVSCKPVRQNFAPHYEFCVGNVDWGDVRWLEEYKGGRKTWLDSEFNQFLLLVEFMVNNATNDALRCTVIGTIRLLMQTHGITVGELGMRMD